MKKLFTTLMFLCMALIALEAQTLSSHYATNPNGVGQRKTVNGYAGFTTSDIIAQGAANDDPRVYRDNSMYEVPIDLYALYGAYDDQNLYLAWDMTNVQDEVAPNDNYPLSQGILYQTMNVPFILLFDTEEGGTDGTLTTGGTIWNTGITWNPIADRVILCSTNAANGPFVYTAQGNLLNPLEIYNRTTSGIDFTTTKFGLGIHPTEIWGIDGGYGTNHSRVPGDMVGEAADWVDFNTKRHNSATMDFHYYMAIPLTTLGVTAAEIETNGIGVQLIATMGKSGMDCLPYDLAMNDNADLPDTESQAFNSYEKSDADVLTSDFARIGGSMGPVVAHNCLVTVATADATMGSVTLMDATGVAVTDSVLSGTQLIATATAAEGYDFVAWMNGANKVSTNAVYSFKVSRNMELTATFKVHEDGPQPIERPESGWTVFFDNSASNWQTVNYYIWTAASVNEVAWPGKTITDITPDGYYMVHSEDMNFVNIIFNNGQSGSGNQTADLTIINHHIYTASGDTGREYQYRESPATALEEMKNDVKVRKILRNGQLLIVRDGVEYTMLGR